MTGCKETEHTIKMAKLMEKRVRDVKLMEKRLRDINFFPIGKQEIETSIIDKGDVFKVEKIENKAIDGLWKQQIMFRKIKC